VPQFEIVAMAEAMTSVARSRRAAVLGEYLAYIERVGPEQAGKLVPGPGETAMAVRRRLSAAAKSVGKELRTARAGQEVYFWQEPVRPRRGRPPKKSV
jgi:hypothetical protein